MTVNLCILQINKGATITYLALIYGNCICFVFGFASRSVWVLVGSAICTHFCGALIVKCCTKKTVIKREHMELPPKVSYKSELIFYSLQSGRCPCFPGGRGYVTNPGDSQKIREGRYTG